MSIEELIENRRAELSAKSDLTPVNLETFVKWKKRKLREKAEAATKSDTKKKDNVKSGQTAGLSGRELFSFNPTMAGEEVWSKSHLQPMLTLDILLMMYFMLKSNEFLRPFHFFLG